MRRPLIVSLALTSAMVLAFFLHRRLSAMKQPGGGYVAELARINRDRRIAPRISITGRHRPCMRDSRDSIGLRCASSPRTVSSDLLDLTGRVSTAITRDLDPAAIHTAALIDLLWSDSAGKSLGRSISSLGAAARLDPSANVVSDLAAAYLVRSAGGGSARDLFEAIENASAALERAPRYAPAAYNLALALDRLGVSLEAGRAWDRALEVETDPDWRMETEMLVRTRSPHGPVARPGPNATAAVLRSYSTRSPQEGLYLAFDSVLAQWGAAELTNDRARASDALSRSEALGEGILRSGGDGSLADAVSVIRKLGEHVAQNRALATAHVEFGEGRRAYVAGRHDAAITHFQEALDASPDETPLRLWSRIFLGASRVAIGMFSEGKPVLEGAISQIDSMRYPSLAARARWMLGTTLLRSGRYEAAIAAYESSADLFVRSREVEHLGAVRHFAAEAAFALGNDQDGFERMSSALRTLQPFRGSVWRHGALWFAAQTAAAHGYFLTAARLYAEGLATAAETGSPRYAAEARLARARERAARGDSVAAHQDLAAARTIIDGLDAGQTRRWLEADMQLARGAMRARTHPALAVAALDSVVTFFASINNPARVMPALVQRAELHLDNGDLARASADLDRIIAILDTQYGAIQKASLRGSLLDAARHVFDRMILAHVAEGNPSTALSYLERSRAALTHSRRTGIGATRPGLRLPGGMAGLEFALIGDTLLTWRVADKDVRLMRAVVPHDSLTSAVERLRAALERRAGDATIRREATRLYDWLVRPVESHSGSLPTNLAIVPDGPLSAIPFAALFDSSRQRYLVEDHELRVGATLSEMSGGDAPGDSDVGALSALLVADPTAQGAELPELRPLPGARDEVGALSGLYDRRVVLVHTAATVDRTLAELRRTRVFHYAGHALFDDVRPERSRLVFSSASSSEHTLAASDIERLDLRHVRLVVLSGCETLRGRESRGGGFSGLAGAFLGAGVRGVVGSLWRVNDSLTHPLMVEFHRAYREHRAPGAALRRAQRALLASNDPALRSPAAWGGFRYSGN